MKHLIALLLVWFALGIAVTALLGHIYGEHRLASWLPGEVPMAVPTACSISALATALLLRVCCHKLHKHL